MPDKYQFALDALDGYCRELVAKIMDILEVSNTAPPLRTLIRDTIYNSKDNFMTRVSKGKVSKKNNCQEIYPTTYKKDYRIKN